MLTDAQTSQRLLGGHFGPALQGPVFQRSCPACGALMTPFICKSGKPVAMVSHEFDCLKKHPELVPLALMDEFKRTLDWERRSTIAKAAARKRKGARK